MKWLTALALLLAAPALAETYAATAFCPHGESVLSSTVASASQSTTVSWEAPTEHTDGTALDDLEGYRLYRSTDGVKFRQVGEVGPGVLTFTDTPPLSAPNAPTNLTVTPGNLKAYSIEKSHNFVATIHVGSVPAGTECDGTQPVKGYYVVPVEAVTFTDADTQAEVVVAQCQPGS